MSNSASNTETFRSQSLGQVNITSFDAMQEIAIHESHRRPATLPLEPSSSSLNSNEIINSSSIISAQIAPIKSTPIDALKEWSVSTYKCTKQMLNERLGKCSKTVDVELDGQVERLRETQCKYQIILHQAKQMFNQYTTIIALQSSMSEQFNELGLRETKTSMTSTSGAENYERHTNLGCDFKQNAEMMKNIAKNGEKLLLALKFFISNLHTLIYKTIEDTMITIRSMESARLEFDAERNSLNNFLSGNITTSSTSSTTTASSTTNTSNTNMNNSTSGNNSSNGNASNIPVTTVTSEKMNIAKAKYERLREDVGIKMQFLDENKSKVMHKQLVLFHNAFAAFASGNATALESTLKQFSIRSQSMSFLEK